MVTLECVERLSFAKVIGDITFMRFIVSAWTFLSKPCCTLPMARVYRKYEEYNIVQRTELLISYYVVSAQSFWTLLFNKLSKT